MASTFTFIVAALPTSRCDRRAICSRWLSFLYNSLCSCFLVRPGRVMMLDSRLKGSRFDSWPLRFQVTTLGKLFTHMCLYRQTV